MTVHRIRLDDAARAAIAAHRLPDETLCQAVNRLLVSAQILLEPLSKRRRMDVLRSAVIQLPLGSIDDGPDDKED